MAFSYESDRALTRQAMIDGTKAKWEEFEYSGTAALQYVAVLRRVRQVLYLGRPGGAI